MAELFELGDAFVDAFGDGGDEFGRIVLVPAGEGSVTGQVTQM